MVCEINQIAQYLGNDVANMANKIKIRLQDGKVVEMYSSDATLHNILWGPLLKYGVLIDSSQVYDLYPTTTDTIAEVQTIQYRELLKTKQDTKQIVYDLWETIHKVYAFAYSELGAYQQSVDLLDLVTLMDSDELRDMIETSLPTDKGTHEAERVFKEKTKELNRILCTPSAMKINPLANLMEAKVLKGGQIPQLLLALGTRSDINDRMLPHVMTCSGVSGMRCIEDMCTEAHSSKKTTRFNTTIIRDSQSFYRVMRLRACNLNTMHSGDCGRRITIKHTIQEGKGQNYLDKLIIDGNGKIVAITEDNAAAYEGMAIELISPITCDHAFGVCEHCAGRATEHPWAYMPHVRLGVYAVSIMCSIISQMVLSAKHLISPKTIVTLLSGSAEQYFIKNADGAVKFNRLRLKSLKHLSLVVECSTIGHMNDLGYEGISPEGFGMIRNIGILDSRTGVTDTFEIIASDVVNGQSKHVMQHIDAPMMEYMHDNRDRIEVVDGAYIIPLDKFNTRRAVLQMIEINDDMVAYSKRVQKMFESGISEYSNIELALTRITNTVFAKVDMNIFYIELVVKALLNGRMPDDGQICINKLGDGIATSNIAAKLGHEDVKRWLLSPELSVVPRQPSPWDRLFGF